MKKQITTLLLIVKDNKILLAQKKRGFGFGKFNGIGGKVEQGETVEEAMQRETMEEINVVPKQFEKRGVINFDEVVKGERMDVKMHIFVAKDFEGKIEETEEMRPQWFDLDKIPYENMFCDDSYWLPLLLEGKKFEGKFVYDDEFKLVTYDLSIL